MVEEFVETKDRCNLLAEFVIRVLNILLRFLCYSVTTLRVLNGNLVPVVAEVCSSRENRLVLSKKRLEHEEV